MEIFKLIEAEKTKGIQSDDLRCFVNILRNRADEYRPDSPQLAQEIYRAANELTAVLNANQSAEA